MARPVLDRECGSGTVLVLAVVGVALVFFSAVAVLASAQLASVRARSAADLAALAAAGTVARAEPSAGCEAAAAVALANGGRLVACRSLPGGDFEVTVKVDPADSPLGAATARARAGPSRAGSPSVRPAGPARRSRPACRGARCHCRTWATAHTPGIRWRTDSPAPLPTSR